MQYLAEYCFSDPATAERIAPRTTVVALTSNSNPKLPASRGQLLVLSPEEVFFALIFAIERDISNGAGADILASWRRYCLSQVIEFRWVEREDDGYFHAINLRERIGAEFEALYLSPLQRAFQLRDFRERMEASAGKTISANQLVRHWNEKIRVSSGDAVTLSMSGSTVTTSIMNTTRNALQDERKQWRPRVSYS